MALFALIAVAGLALVDSVIGVQGKTEKRLDRLADLQRTMFVLGSDLDQVSRGRINGGGHELAFTRAAPGLGGRPVPVQYSVRDGLLLRLVGPVPQQLLSGVSDARWRFWTGSEWIEHWPPSEEQEKAWPRAIEVQLAVATPGGGAGTVRRVVALPAQGVEK